jgi:predicted RNA-binding Zn-ribbon protein involved in translation (DUF1610 family)
MNGFVAHGENNLARFGVLGILVRCSDKLARIENLLKRDAEVKDETQADTWRDLAGYAVQCLIMFFWKDESLKNAGDYTYTFVRQELNIKEHGVGHACPNCGGHLNASNISIPVHPVSEKVVSCDNCRWCDSTVLFCRFCGIQLPHKDENGLWHNPNDSHTLKAVE